MRFLKEYLIDRWGLLVFIFLLMVLFFFNRYASAREATLLSTLYSKKICAYLIAVYAVVALASWVSYPQVYKTRSFMMGPVFLGLGVYTILYLSSAGYLVPGLVRRPDMMLFKKTMLLLVVINMLLLALMPTYLEYRRVRSWALVLLAAECLGLPLWFKYFTKLGTVFEKAITVHFRPLLLVVCMAVLALSLIRLGDDDKLGGAWAGLSVFIAVQAFKIQGPGPMAFLVVFPAILIVIILNHWFNSLHHRAQYDPLLRIYNRSFYQSIVEGKTNISLGSQYCVAVCDLDHFKRINDRAGHQAGDLVLQGAAQTIRHQALPRGITCRYGGEEIVIFFRKTGIEEAEKICQHIRRAVAGLTFRSGRRKIKVTVSIGVASNKRFGDQVGKVVATADKAVYQAKKEGRNRVVKK